MRHESFASVATQLREIGTDAARTPNGNRMTRQRRTTIESGRRVVDSAAEHDPLSPATRDGSDRLGRRPEDSLSRERREGPSRLSTWSRRRVLITGIAWVVVVVGLIGVGAIISIARDHNADDVRDLMTRSNLILLAISLVLPPACLTFQWWYMRQRRRERM
jgi:hypothetical protein